MASKAGKQMNTSHYANIFTKAFYHNLRKTRMHAANNEENVDRAKEHYNRKLEKKYLVISKLSILNKLIVM